MGWRLQIRTMGKRTDDWMMGIGEHGQPRLCDLRRQLTPFFDRPGTSASGPADRVAANGLLVLGLCPWDCFLLF